jgi:hypothetical protein
MAYQAQILTVIEGAATDLGIGNSALNASIISLCWHW